MKKPAKKAAKKKPGPPKTKGKDPMRSLRVPDAEWEAWRAKAQGEGLSLTAWLRKVANRNAR